MISKKIFVVSLLLAIVLTAGVTSAYFLYLVPSPTTASQQVATQLVHLSRYTGGTEPNESPLYAAEVEGIYQQNGLVIDQIPLDGTSAAVQALAADKSGFAFVWGDLLDEIVIKATNPSSPA